VRAGIRAGTKAVPEWGRSGAGVGPVLYFNANPRQVGKKNE